MKIKLQSYNTKTKIKSNDDNIQIKEKDNWRAYRCYY